MKKDIQEKTVSDLRVDLNKFGYSEKGNELNSGGELQSNFVNILSYLLKEWKEKNGDSCKLQFTAGNDTFHKNRKSRHTNGEAVDLTLSQECRQSFIKILERYKSIYNGFSYIDEYTHPSKGATGGHFHLSYRQGQPEGVGNNKENDMNNEKTSTTDTPETTDDTTVSSGDRHNVYGGLLDIIPGLDTAKKDMERLLNQTESIDNKLDRLNEDIDKIKKLIKY
jgi:hypothetical protein